MSDFWIVRHRPWARLEPGGHRWTPELATKNPSAEALKLMEPLSWAGWKPLQFPTEFGDLIWLTYRAGAQLMEGMKYSKGSWDFLFFYPEPGQLRERLAVLGREAKVPPGPLGEIRRFVALYEAAYQERTEWVQVTESVDDTEDETKDDDAIEEPQEVTELLGEEVVWGDPELMRRKTRPIPGEFHREPVIILHP